MGRCPMCSSPRRDRTLALVDQLHGVPGRFTYPRCTVCGTVYQDPRVVDEDLAACYPEDYYTHQLPTGAAIAQPAAARPLSGFRDTVRRAVVAAVRGRREPGPAGALGWVASMSAFVRRRAFYDLLPDELLPRVPPPARALDAGCGAGQLLTALRGAGWNAEGLEWDKTAAEGAAKRSGCQVYVGDIRTVALPTDAYQLVTLSHVLEHIDDPPAVLRRLRDLLAPGGIAVVYWPNPGALGARWLGELWLHWDAPRHLVLPSLAALDTAGRKVGLLPRRIFTTARLAAAFLSYSRDLMEGRIPDFDRPKPSASERALAALEGAMVRLGIQVGEEGVSILARG